MNPLVIVTGIPRSGTSCMMRCLELGGITCVYSNPERVGMRNIYGFYEGGVIPPEGNVAVKRFGHKKVMDMFDGKYDCYFIVMNRPTSEILASWNAVGILSNQPTMVGLQGNRDKNMDAMSDKKNITVNYDDLCANPLAELQRVADFIPLPLNVADAVTGVDVNLYINRGEGI